MKFLFKGLFDAEGAAVIEVTDFLLCLGVSLLIGAFIAFAYTVRERYTKSFLITLALLPSVVCVVIMMVNGNVGTGVAVAGAFSLVRFRSAPGSAKEICMLFLAMGSGLIAGMGYLAYAVLFAIVTSGAFIIYNLAGFGARGGNTQKTLTVTIPEDLSYTSAFDDVFEKYTARHELIKSKTTNMGSMFKLTYNVTLLSPDKEKEFIDTLRERNGNLEISIACLDTSDTQL